MAIKLTEEQRKALPENDETPLEAVDDRGRRYFLISEASYRKLQALLAAEHLDPSLYEFDDT